jgi:hypothetical protein
MAADFSKIIAGCIESYGALGPDRYFNVVGEEVTVKKEYLQDDASEEQTIWKQLLDTKSYRIVEYPYEILHHVTEKDKAQELYQPKMLNDDFHYKISAMAEITWSVKPIRDTSKWKMTAKKILEAEETGRRNSLQAQMTIKERVNEIF